ncbi:DEAD/DEAH box helicase [Aliigemmobacter aestuarii]
MTTIAAPLAAALSDRGYASLTPVQQAMLAPEIAGRDLLVSAQTGSGKTVAFGLAVAGEILGGIDALLPADKPIALIIAPTRELAQQVARELGWLYANAGAQIATCVGGMDYRTERRALERGAHIVVGTPGRLRDHIERGSLDLSEARAVVLDEADEMLDLGFAEDLEFILSAAPEGRRTLMFSATVPKEIAKLAETFQRDAQRIEVKGEATQHADIEYRALSVSPRDREGAIFNVLRFYDAQTAIVFCKTRTAVNHLLARMGNRGFQAVALSGELSQSERMHALQALRDGRARVCIATDVAARGIDLPGLELVIHADLPSNSETLLHRSGRTGRAGQKGVSALIVAGSEYKKAHRLLQGAKVVAEWGQPPSADQVQEREDARMLDHPALADAPGDEEALAVDLLDRYGPEQVAAAFVRLWRQGRSAPEVLRDDVSPGPAPAEPRPRTEFGASRWFVLSVGHTGRAEARWLLPKICDAGGITRNDIGAIRVQQERTFVQIATKAAERFADGIELENGILMEPMDDEPDLARPERGAPRSGARPDRRPAAPRDGAAPRPARAPREDRPRDDRPREERPAYRSAKPPRFVDEDASEAPRPRRDAQAEAPRKPWARKEDAGEDRAPRKPRAVAEEAPRPRKPRDEGGWTPRAPRGEDAPRPPRRAEGDAPAPRKPRWTPDDRDRAANPAPRSAGFKSHGGGAGKPARSAGYKSHGGAEDRPARSSGFKSHGDKPHGDRPPRAEGADARPARSGGFKSHGDRPKPEGKPYGKPASGSAGKPGGKPFGKPAGKFGAKPAAAAKPARPKADARDTSKRFVPPKKK